MRQLSRFFLTIGILSLLLSACGTSNESNSSNKSVNGTEQTVDQNEATGKETEQPKTEDQTGQEDNNESAQKDLTVNSGQEDEKIRLLEQNISYSINGETKEETAFLKKSDNQDFSLYVLPAYELTAEEPNKDVLFLTGNDQIFMRIEILPTEIDLNSLKETTLAQLQVVNENVTTLDPPPNEEFLQNATIMEASKDGDVVTAYLINHQDTKIKLTLFTKEQADHRDAFFQMAKTIQ